VAATTSAALTSTSTAELGSAVGRDASPKPVPGQVGHLQELSDVPVEALVPLLTAEVTLLQARLDEVQRQLARLNPG
jgi:hypothetical protein